MARGVSESSEFVTKRMCFSLIFSVSFLSLLCGFLLGRFATQRAIEFRAEKKRIELAGNGLENTEYLQRLMLEQLERAPLDPDFEMYVVVSASGEGVGVALELAKIFNEIQGEYKWKPRRSLIFCLFSGSLNPCPEILSSFMSHRIVAYIVVHHQALQGKGPFIVSGSDIIQSIVLESASIVKSSFSYNDQLLSLNNTFHNVTTSRLALEIPHAVLSFTNYSVTYNENHHEKELRKIILAQILGQTVWRLSECLVIKWNPNYLNEIASKALQSINNTELVEVKGKVQEILVDLTTNVKTLNGKIDTIENINTLDTRILNDLLIDLDRVLLCSDKQHQSRTDWTEFFRLHREPFNIILMYINEMIKCYENAIQLLQNR
ncbi:hypothetical protein WH47_05855 [Habropoda laboriosa]|uniref:Transferrin receptor protein 1 n=1 Tax=Habropoda laboriosa TaxID=597456 RepID=A0A0L7QU35_9HYME|nr:hypothetical protein WH47_05855 [Habropoda laboriosa]